jgi:hypothetical protein
VKVVDVPDDAQGGVALVERRPDLLAIPVSLPLQLAGLCPGGCRPLSRPSGVIFEASNASIDVFAGEREVLLARATSRDRRDGSVVEDQLEGKMAAVAVVRTKFVVGRHDAMVTSG